MNGETYLSSKGALDIVYDALTEEVADPPKSWNEAVFDTLGNKIANFEDGPDGKLTKQSVANVITMASLFPNFKSFEQAVAYDNDGPLADEIVSIVEEYFNF